MTAPSAASTNVRVLLATVAFLIGIIAALVAGILQQASHKPMPQTIEYSCGAFAATVLFVFSVFTFLGGRKD